MNNLLPIADALISCLKLLDSHTEPPTAIPAPEIDEFNGLRDAQEGHICLDGQSSEYYHGYQEGEY